MATTQAEALLSAILERCARSPKGYPMDASHVIIALLIGHGLLVAREDYRVALTAKGREIYAMLPLSMKGEPTRGAAKPSPSTTRMMPPSARRKVKIVPWGFPRAARAP
jgi:hypothetical protein